MLNISGFKPVIAAALLGASVSAFAIPSTSVGDVDTLLASTKLANSGEGFEEAWVESVLGINVFFDDKLESDFSWELVDGTASTYAQAFTNTPDYYLVKTGKLSGTTDTHFLFQNVSELYYGVINLTAMGFSVKEGIGKISHISLFDTAVNVPEPGTLSLFVLGLLGLGYARSKAT